MIKKNDRSQNKKSFLGQRTLAEKVSFALSLSIVSLVVVLVCYTGITADNQPPILSVTLEAEVRHIEQQYYLPFTIVNSGGETVESVEIVAKLSFPDQEIQTGRQEIDFLSPLEKRSGEFIFDRDFTQGNLEVRVASYRLP